MTSEYKRVILPTTVENVERYQRGNVKRLIFSQHDLQQTHIFTVYDDMLWLEKINEKLSNQNTQGEAQ